jgi:hypothetical protein
VWEKTAVRNQASKARQTLNENRFEEIKQLEVEVRGAHSSHHHTTTH